MRRSQFSDDEIVRLLRQAESGTPAAEVCRTAGVSQRTFYRWQERFAGLTAPDLSKMRALQMENRRLRSVLEDLVRTPAVARSTLSSTSRSAVPPQKTRSNTACHPFLRVRP